MPLTPEEIAELTADPSPLNPIPMTMYGEPAGPRQYRLLTAEEQAQSPEVQRAANEFAKVIPRGGMMGDLLQQIPLAMQPTSFLGNLALNTATGAGIAANAGGSSPEDVVKGALFGGGGGAALQKAGQLVRYLGSAIPKKAFDTAQEAKIGDWLKERVPWWKDLTLAEMSTAGKSKEALKQGYEKAFTEARDQIPEAATATIPIDVANALKLKGESGIDTRFMTRNARAAFDAPGSTSGIGKTLQEGLETVKVNARELLDKLPGSEGKLRAQIMKGLEETAGKVIPEAREAYKAGRGWMAAANRGGIFKGGTFDAQKAQAAMNKPIGEESLAQKVLQSRNMGELENIVRGPLQKPIESVTPNTLAWHLGLGGAGLLGGFGLHGLHGLAGGLAGLIPRPTFYRNVPPMYPQAGPLAQQGLRAVMPGFLGNLQSSQRED